MAAITVMPLVLSSLWLGVDGFTKVPCVGVFLVRSVMRPLRNDRLARVRATRIRGPSEMGGNVAFDDATPSSTVFSEASEPEDGDPLNPEICGPTDMGENAIDVATTSSVFSSEPSELDDGDPSVHECHRGPGAVSPGVLVAERARNR